MQRSWRRPYCWLVIWFTLTYQQWTWLTRFTYRISRKRTQYQISTHPPLLLQRSKVYSKKCPPNWSRAESLKHDSYKVSLCYTCDIGTISKNHCGSFWIVVRLDWIKEQHTLVQSCLPHPSPDANLSSKREIRPLRYIYIYLPFSGSFDQLAVSFFSPTHGTASMCKFYSQFSLVLIPPGANGPG